MRFIIKRAFSTQVGNVLKKFTAGSLDVSDQDTIKILSQCQEVERVPEVDAVRSDRKGKRNE
jgi:hypothetical protein